MVERTLTAIRYLQPFRQGGSVPALVEADDGRSWRTRTVVNATGTWTQPFVPYYPGIATFAGEQFHTAHYPGAEHFVGKRVVVVGGCRGVVVVSGCWWGVPVDGCWGVIVVCGCW